MTDRAPGERREDGWDELRRAIDDELAGAKTEVGEPFYAGAAAAYNYVLSHWPLAAARGEPGLREAATELVAAFDATPAGATLETWVRFQGAILALRAALATPTTPELDQ